MDEPIYGILIADETDSHRHERLSKVEGEGLHLRRQDGVRPSHGERRRYESILHLAAEVSPHGDRPHDARVGTSRDIRRNWCLPFANRYDLICPSWRIEVV